MQNLKGIFIKASAASVFLVASLVTIATAPNDAVMLGGAGLSLTATFDIAASLNGDFAKKFFKLIRASALIGNAAFTLNGMNMMSSSFAGNASMDIGAAGAALIIANAGFYGIANLRDLTDNITPKGHAMASMGGGVMIAAAGLTLANPALSLVGLGFFTEAAMRYKEAMKSDPELSGSRSSNNNCSSVS